MRRERGGIEGHCVWLMFHAASWIMDFEVDIYALSFYCSWCADVIERRCKITGMFSE